MSETPQFKPGDRVRVQIDSEATVGDAVGGERFAVRLAGQRRNSWVYPEHLTLIRPPLAKGDVITTDTPCPEVGTAWRANGCVRIWGEYTEDTEAGWPDTRDGWLGATVKMLDFPL